MYSHLVNIWFEVAEHKAESNKNVKIETIASQKTRGKKAMQL